MKKKAGTVVSTAIQQKAAAASKGKPQQKLFLSPGRVVIKCTCKTVPMDLALFRNRVVAMRSFLNCDVFDLGVQLGSDKFIAKKNKEYLEKEGPTDIISVPVHEVI